VSHRTLWPDSPAGTLPRVDTVRMKPGTLSHVDMAGTRSFTLSGGLRVDDLSASEAVRACRRRVEAGATVHVCTVNPEIAVLALSDPAYHAAVTAADVITIDGVGISFAVLRQHGRFPARLTGVALMHALVRDAAAHGREVVIVGAGDESRREAEARLRARGVLVRDGVSPRVAGDGSDGLLPEGLVPDRGVVLVALGSPKQELWIRRQVASGAPPAIWVGIGGAVDYLSGAVPTPPRLVRRLGLQWLYRLVTEPRARFRRQMSTLPRFFWRQVARGG